GLLADLARVYSSRVSACEPSGWRRARPAGAAPSPARPIRSSFELRAGRGGPTPPPRRGVPGATRSAPDASAPEWFRASDATGARSAPASARITFQLTARGMTRLRGYV